MLERLALPTVVPLAMPHLGEDAPRRDVARLARDGTLARREPHVGGDVAAFRAHAVGLGVGRREANREGPHASALAGADRIQDDDPI